jgi:HK97 gp10 family phage protein
MARTTVKGLDKLRAKLRAMPDEVRREIRGALEKNAEELTAMQKRLVPVDDGDLRDSIEWNWGTGDESRIGVKGEQGLAITVSAGNREIFYAGFREFGTVKLAAAPFFFPSYRALRRRMKSRVSRAQNKAIKRIAAR